jgi:hypothetical protein
MRLKNYIIQVTLSVSFCWNLRYFFIFHLEVSFDLAEFRMIVDNDQLLVRSRDRIADTVFDQEDRRKRIKIVI